MEPVGRVNKENKLIELGLYDVLESSADKNKVNKILKSRLLELGNEIKSKESSKLGSLIKKIPARRDLKIEKSFDYLEVFCLYSAQKYEKENIFSGKQAIDEEIHETIDLIEEMKKNFEESKGINSEKLNTLTDKIINIWEVYLNEEPQVGARVFSAISRLKKIK